ncbi:phosphoprotein [Merida virus]|uniref:Phosphoprotein n=1 Tax=Merida virus TaxID=1803034 RepID=A0A140DDD8_9RHAB|nr:phosphoprotein [Merida virus]AMK38065.1 phosphoprotein [Merida virus]
MSNSGGESDHTTKSQEDSRIQGFYSEGVNLPQESVSCLGALLEYDQEGLEKTFSQMDLEDPLTGEREGGSVQVSVPWGTVSEEQQAEYLRLLRLYNIPHPDTPEEDTGVDEDELSSGTPSLPPTSPSLSSEGGDRPLSPFLFSDEEYTEYVDITVPEELQDVALRTPLISLLRDVVRIMVNSKNEPFYSLQKYDLKQGTVRLARVGNLYTYCPEGTPIPVLEQRGSPKTRKKRSLSTPQTNPTESSAQGPTSSGSRADPTPSCSTTKTDIALGQTNQVSQTTEESWPSPDHSGSPSNLEGSVTIKRAASPSSSSHYSQTSSVESSSEDEEEIEVAQESYSFMCPIYGSSEMSVKVFPGHEVEPLMKLGMVPPEIFRAILRDRGLLRALEAVLDIGQTHMT